MFKKMFVLFVLAIIAIGVIAGCGQQTPTINTAVPQPSGLTIRGTVHEYNINDSLGDPVAGATVFLSGASLSFNASTDAKGEYTIQGIPDGNYTITTTKEGYQRTSGSSITIKPTSNVPANGTISVRDIVLYSNPVIFSYSPVSNAVVSADQAFTVTFNEVIDRSTFKPTLTAEEIRTMAAGDGSNTGITVTSTDNKTFTITPTQTLVSNESYTLTINSSVTDLAGFPLDTDGEQAMYNTVTYRVGTGGLPGAPSNLAIVYGTTTECDYTKVYQTAANIYLSWTSPAGSVPTGYNVYTAYGSSGNYTLVGSSISNQIDLRTDGTATNNIIDAIYGSVNSRDPVCTGGYPFINDVCRFKVVAINGDGESATGTEITARDVVGPTLNGNNDSTMATASKLTNNVPLPKLGIGEAYISFTEPISAVGAAALYHIGTYEATSATLVAGSNSAAVEASIAHLAGARSVVKVVVAGPVTAGWLASVEAGAATDLSGNLSPANTGAMIN